MKFSIRDLLLLTVIVALVVGWWLDRRELRRKFEQETLRVVIEDLAREVQLARLKVEMAEVKADAELAKVRAEERRLSSSSKPAAP
jgi:hypothetical protein